MTSYDSTNVYRKIMSLEDKLNRLEDMLEYTKGGGYVSSPSYYKGGGERSHYKSAVRLSRATQDFKQDLLQNPHHGKLGRDSYQQIYKRVSVLEKELNDIVQKMDLQSNQRPVYNYYSNPRSESLYDVSPYTEGCNNHSNSCIINRPQRKRITYDSYVELVPNDSSSSESTEEIIYYIEPPSTSSSSSTLIVEEYIPKSYTRRSLKTAPIIDVSKSKPKPSVRKPPPKKKNKIQRGSTPISLLQVRKSKKGKKKIRLEKSDSDASERKERSELFLVKRSKESPKNIEKNKKKREKYFVSRLLRVDSTSGEENNSIKNKKKVSAEKSSVDKKYLKSDTKPSKHKEIKKKNKSGGNDLRDVQQKKKYKQNKVKREPFLSKKFTETTIVANSSFILNDPFVRTIYYDDLESHGKENNTIIKAIQSKKSESEVGDTLTSVYEMMSNSVYFYDPILKQKEKLHPKERKYNTSFSQCSKNLPHENHKSTIHKVNENDIIVNNGRQKHRQHKFTFKQTKNSKNLEKSYSNNLKQKTDDSSIKGLSSPIAHSVYLTTIPVNQSGYHDIQFPSQPQIHTAIIPKSNSKDYKIPGTLNSPREKRTVVEDEIFINVARKLSPIVAKIINSHLSKSKEHLQSDSSISPTDNNLYSAQSKVNLESSQLVKHKKSKDNEFKVITDSINPTNIFREPQNNLVYISKIEDDSHLVLKKPSKVKSVFKKSKTLSSVSNLLKKSSPRKGSKYSTEKQSGDSIPIGESISMHQRVSTTIAKPRSSQISQKPKRASKVSQKPKASTNRLKSNLKGDIDEFTILEPLQRSSSFARVQNFEPKKSVSNKSKTQNGRKKSVSRMKSMLNKMKSEEKLPKNKTEPTLISILSKMKTGNKSSKILNKAQTMETIESLEKETHRTDLEQKQVPVSRIENFTQNLNQEMRTQSKVSPEQYIEDEPALLVNIEVYDGKSENVRQYQNEGAQNQSKIDTRIDSIVQEPSHQSRMIGSIAKDFNNKFRTQLKKHSSRESVTDAMPHNNIVDNPNAAFNNSGSYSIKEVSDSEVLYSGSRRYINKIRSVSQYEEPNLKLMQDGDVGRNRSLPSQLRNNSPIETTLIGSTNNQSLFGEERSKVTEPSLNDLEDITHLATKETSRTLQDLQHVPPYNKKPLQFCIHFSKEKRIKYESQPTVSLDNVLSSQCKKIYSSEDISLSEYAFDEYTDSYNYRKVHPKKGKKFYKRNVNLLPFPKGQDAYCNHFIKNVHSNSKCCCKTSRTTKSVQLISEGSYLDWHEVANEIKEGK